MAQQNKNTLQNWLKRGMKPLQQQFWDWLDSYWHKDEDIPMAKVAGLAEALNAVPNADAITQFINYINGISIVYNADGFYLVPAGYFVEKIFVLPTAEISFQIGTAAGAEDILPAIVIDTAGEVVSMDHKMPGNIYFTGITTATRIQIFLRPRIVTVN